MQEQIEQGSVPPAGIIMEDIDGVLVRDALGNVQGGVRVPSMDAPVATYISTNQADPNLPANLIGIGDLACRLSGAVRPFDQETLDELYTNHGAYVKQVKVSTRALRDSGLLLHTEAKQIQTTAAQSDIGN